MAEKIAFTLQDLYKTLRRHDVDILKHFNDDDLNDFDYLYYAINSDIMNNALSIVMNMLMKNEERLLRIIRFAEMDHLLRNVTHGLKITLKPKKPC